MIFILHKVLLGDDYTVKDLMLVVSQQNVEQMWGKCLMMFEKPKLKNRDLSRENA